MANGERNGFRNDGERGVWVRWERERAVTCGRFGYHVLSLLILKPSGDFCLFSVLFHIISLKQGYY